jgi:hypothetical protein
MSSYDPSDPYKNAGGTQGPDKILPGNVQQLTDHGKVWGTDEGNKAFAHGMMHPELREPKKKEAPKIEWGWMIRNAEHAHGPFDSREEAVEDAKDYCHNTSLDGVIYGICRWGDPKTYLPDMDELLDRMNEVAYDDEFGFFDDEIFDVSSKEDAKNADIELETFLRAWADRWINSNAWILEPESAE